MEKPKRRRGQPEFKPTKAQRDDVMLAKANGLAEPAIAAALGICQNTLRKHFAFELQSGHSKKMFENLKRLEKAAKAGNVTAMRTLQSNMHLMPPDTAPEPKPEPLGKKERATLDAQTAHEETGWGELLN